MCYNLDMQTNQKNGKDRPIVWTAAHSNRPIQALLDLLHSADITTVIDCRSKPRSRWPQYNGAQLAVYLAKAKIKYEPRGSSIGGYPGNTYFQETLDEIAQRAEKGERLALLCSEAKPEACHRGTILTPELVKRGVTVEHLLYEVKPAQARLKV